MTGGSGKRAGLTGASCLAVIIKNYAAKYRPFTPFYSMFIFRNMDGAQLRTAPRPRRASGVAHCGKTTPARKFLPLARQQLVPTAAENTRRWGAHWRTFGPL
jgi:hypothetical protein